MNRIPLIAASILLLVAIGSRAESTDRLIQIDAEFVRATPAKLGDALKAVGLPASPLVKLTPVQFEAIKKSFKEDDFEFLGTLSAITSSGHHAAVNAVREVRYPSQYEPSQKDAGKFVPTEFETRNAGLELEFEATKGPADLIDVTLVATSTTFLGFIDFSGAKPARENDGVPALEDLLKAPLTEGGQWQPVFSSLRVTSTITVMDRVTMLLAGEIASPQVNPPGGGPAIVTKKPGKGLYLFVTARTVTAD